MADDELQGTVHRLESAVAQGGLDMVLVGADQRDQSEQAEDGDGFHFENNVVGLRVKKQIELYREERVVELSSSGDGCRL